MVRTAAVLAAIVAVGVAVSSTHRLHDLTAEHSLTLTDQTRAVLDDLDRDVEIVAFLRRDEPGRVDRKSVV